MNLLSSILPVSRQKYEALRTDYHAIEATMDAQVQKLQRQISSLKVREFKGAAQNRLTQYIDATHQGINKDIQSQGRELLARARDLAKNTALGRRYLQLYHTNVIGPTGHKFQSNAVDKKIENSENGKQEIVVVPDVLANAKIEEAWLDWCKKGNCTMDGRQSFGGFSKLTGLSKSRDGEAIIHKVIDPNAQHPLKLQLIPPEAVAYELNQRLPNGNVIIMGIELDTWWRPVAYYLSPIRPKDEFYGLFGYRRDYTRVLAESILHWFDQEYQEQTRGVTKFAPVMLDMFDLHEYDDATVKNAIITARKLGFLTNREGVESKPLKGDGQDEEGNIIIDGDTGSISDIEDKNFTPWDPQFPHSQYEMFDRVKTRRIASGLGLAYSSLANDYSQTSFSSMRQELGVERDNWKTEQQSFVDMVLQPLFSEWLMLEMLAGNIKLPSSKFDKFNNPVFIGPRWKGVDPTKDIGATKEELAAGLASPYDKAAEFGQSLEEIYADLASARDLAAEYGLKLDWGTKPVKPEPDDPPPAKKSGKAKEDEEDEDDDDPANPKRSQTDLAGTLADHHNGNGHH